MQTISDQMAKNLLISKLMGVLNRLDISYRLSVMDGVWWIWSEGGNKAWCLQEIQKVELADGMIAINLGEAGELFISKTMWIDRTN